MKGTPMKHLVIHLISLILLIVLFLALLDEIGSKTAGDKQLKDASAKLEQLTAENTRNAASLAESKATVADLEGKLALLEQSVSEMENRFQIVSARDVKMLGLAFEQTPRTQADAVMSMNLADSQKNASPADFKDAAEKALAPLIAASHELVLDPVTGYVVEPVAAIIETAAKSANLAASTAIFWDVTRKEIRSEVTISDPAKKTKDAVVSIGGNPKLFRDSTFQLSPKTTIFPFIDLSLLSRSTIDLLTRSASIPVGGLYVHYFRVYSKGPWVLEYVFPENLEPESVNMNLLPLTPGSSISSSVSGRTFTFHIAVENKEAAFLVIADKAFFPEKASIRLK